MQDTTFAFCIVNARGDRVASAEHFEDALFWMRTLPEAEQVLKMDGTPLAFKKRYTPARPHGAA